MKKQKRKKITWLGPPSPSTGGCPHYAHRIQAAVREDRAPRVAPEKEEIHAARARGEPRRQHPALDPPLPPSLLDLAATTVTGPLAGPCPRSAIARCHGHDPREHATSTFGARGPRLGDRLPPLDPLLGEHDHHGMGGGARPSPG